MSDLNVIKEELHKFVDTRIKELEILSETSIKDTMPSKTMEELKNIDINHGTIPISQAIEELRCSVLHYGFKGNHPRFFGFIPGVPSIESWVGDLVTSAYNLHAATWESNPAGTIIEESLINWFCNKVNYDLKTAGGLFVSGGTMANLTGITAARDSKITNEQIYKSTVYLSDQTHNSLRKALKVIGIPKNNIRYIRTNNKFEMDALHLENMIEQDIENKNIPFLVIATAGTTNTGAVDPMKEISSIAQKYNLWMHVDGAFGASVLLSEKYKNLIDGIDLADSISWDGHKWLYQTFGCAMILVKDKQYLLNSFSDKAEYLKDMDSEKELNYMDYGIELTRPARALRLWLTFRTLGVKKIGENITYNIDLVKSVSDIIASLPSWELVSEPQLSIINFRYVPSFKSNQEIDQLNLMIAKNIRQENFAGIYTTELNGRVVLRIAAINPNTTYKDIHDTLSKLNSIAIKL